jgi:two-component system sensor histidine kinase/response regulator
MPEMDGIAATARIREGELSTLSHIPIVAMTAHTMKGDRERCLAAGMDGYVSKPINAEALEDAIASLLHLRTGGEGQENAEQKPVEGVTGWNRRETLEGLGGDENLLREVTEIFREQAPKHLDSLRAAIAQQDAKTVETSAHSLKGELGYLSVPEMHRIARELEDAGRNGDLERAATLLPQFEAGLATLLHSMHSPVSVTADLPTPAEYSRVNS